MSKVGFSNQLFGFNKAEVNYYIEKTYSDFKKKEDGLEKTVAQLESELKEVKEKLFVASEQLKKTKEDYSDVKSRLDYYSGKEAEIEKTSASIATMYLVAKQNSEEILSSAKATANEIFTLSKKQLEAADLAEEKLLEIKKAISLSAENFENEVTLLTEELSETKENFAVKTALFEGGNTVEITDGGSDL